MTPRQKQAKQIIERLALLGLVVEKLRGKLAIVASSVEAKEHVSDKLRKAVREYRREICEHLRITHRYEPRPKTIRVTTHGCPGVPVMEWRWPDEFGQPHGLNDKRQWFAILRVHKDKGVRWTSEVEFN